MAGARGGAERAGQSDAAAGCAPALALGDVGIAAGGQFRLMGNRSNFGFHDRTVGPDQAPNTIGNQRFRTWVNVHDRTSCRYGGYTQIEIGHLDLGSGLEFPKTFGSGGDRVGVEMRRGFLWFRPAEGALVRAGVLPWEDRFGERPTFADPLWGINRAATAAPPWRTRPGSSACPASRWRPPRAMRGTTRWAPSSSTATRGRGAGRTGLGC